MTETKTFPTLDVVSASTGILVCDLYDMYDVLNWMLDDTLWRHQTANASRTVQPYLEAQHPWLADLNLPAGNLPRMFLRVNQILDEHGETLVVERPENPEWVRHNGLMDLLQIADGRPVLTVTLPEASAVERTGEAFVQVKLSADQLTETFEKLAKSLGTDE